MVWPGFLGLLAEGGEMTVNWTEWALPIRRLELPAPGVIDLWLCQLSSSGGEAGSQAERSRVQRFRQQFLLRLLLAAYLDTPGKDLVILRDSHGKPRLEDERLQFNVAHSGAWWVLAVRSDGPVGVDIEVDRAVRDPAALARRFFHASAAAHLETIEDERNLKSAFLRLWAGHEALVKATGVGLARGLEGLMLDPRDGALQRVPQGWPAPEQWSLTYLCDPSPLTIAVAAPQPQLIIRPRRLQALALSAATASLSAAPPAD
jgi:phosphopantetheinyl transferase